MLEWVAVPSSRGSSQPRDQTCISCLQPCQSAFFTTRATWEAYTHIYIILDVSNVAFLLTDVIL